MTNTYDIAVSHATSLAGETLIKLLEERQFPAIKLYPLDASADSDTTVEYMGEELDLVAADNVNLARVDFLFIPAGSPRDQAMMMKAIEAGCTVIDGSVGAATSDSILPVLPGINDYQLEEARMNRYVAFPASPAATLLPVLHAIQTRYGINRLTVTACLAVANAGNEGVTELRNQTIQLLNGKPVEQNTWPHRVAYNLLPQVGDIDEQGVTKVEQQIKQETNALLHNELDMRITCMIAPVFYGDSLVVDLDTDEPMDIYEISGLLGEEENVDVAMGQEYPTAEEAAGSDQVKLGRLRQSSVYGTDLSFWVTADGVRRGALIAVELAELLIKDLG